MKNLFNYKFNLNRSEIENRQGYKGCVLWMVGLSGSGKSTLANKLQQEFFSNNINVKILDGDALRQGLCGDLTFSEKDRDENLRRVAHISKLFADHGIITICSFISPLKKHRDLARKIIGSDYIEVFVDTSISECQKRDPKGLYKKANDGIIPNFTGIGAPFEPPKDSHIHLNSDLDKMCSSVLRFLIQNKILNPIRGDTDWKKLIEEVF